ncbi:hypothetical protein ACF09K_29750, partial [Streptomyces sp. NPDC014882]|uniref:hypothetical protein n=1 Tax=Streptomyces sp. NPDC014882 TaxID=3364927 RepID=UPI0036FD1D58
RLYQTVSRPDLLGAFQNPALFFAVSFPAVPTLSDPFGSDSLSAGFALGFRLSPVGLSTFTTLADSLADS